VTTGAERPYEPSPEAQKLYADFIGEVNKRELSGSENFDKSVLTLSSAGLALSITFLKDFGPLSSGAFPWMLYASWGMFTIATLSTMVSFQVSGKALNHQKVVARRAYMEGEEKAFDEVGFWSHVLLWLNRTSAVTFVAALSFTIAFIISNLEGNRMATGNYKAPTTGSLEQRGAPVPTMQRPVSPPVAAPAVPASAPSGGPGSGNVGAAK
jgi:hypothetical protein